MNESIESDRAFTIGIKKIKEGECCGIHTSVEESLSACAEYVCSKAPFVSQETAME